MNFTEAIVLAVEKVKAWIQSGGVKWDHVSDKPFVKFGGDTLTWDGNTEGRAIGTIGGIPVYVKVSDVVLTIDDFANGGKITVNGEIVDFTSSEVSELDLIFVGPQSQAVIVPPELAGLDLGGEDSLFPEGTIFPEAGLYFVNGDGLVATSLTIPGYTGFAKEQIDPKVLPEGYPYKKTVHSDTLTWDGNTEGLVSVMGQYYKVSDAVPTIDDFSNGVILTVGEVSVSISANDIKFFGGLILASVEGLGCVVVPEEMAGTEIVGMTFPESGVYFTTVGDHYVKSITIPNYTGFTKTEVHPMSEELLPVSVKGIVEPLVLIRKE